MSEFQSWKQPIQLFNNKGSYYYRATADQLKPVLYGIKKTAHWPDCGLHKVMLQGVIFWLEPRGWGKQSRLMCQCPHCPKQISYGRLHQHLRVHHDS
jgi:hypothetical protein